MNELLLAMKGFLVPGIPLTTIGGTILIVIPTAIFGGMVASGKEFSNEEIGTVAIVFIVGAVMTALGAWFLHLALV